MKKLILTFGLLAVAATSAAKEDKYEFMSNIYRITNYGDNPKEMVIDGQTYMITDDHMELHSREEQQSWTPEDDQRAKQSFVIYDESDIAQTRSHNGVPAARFQVNAKGFRAKSVYSFSEQGYIVIKDFREYVVIPMSEVKRCLDLQQEGCITRGAVKYKYYMHYTPNINVDNSGKLRVTVDGQTLTPRSRTNVEVALSDVRVDQAFVDGASDEASEIRN